MVWVGWIVYAFAVLAAAGGLTHALMKSLLKVDAMDARQPWAGFSTEDITDGTLATVLGIMGFFLIFAAVGLLVMLARGVPDRARSHCTDLRCQVGVGGR